MFRNAKIGDKVWDFVCGAGVVTEINEDEQYPLTVTFKDGFSETFTYDGKYNLTINQTLFWDRFEFTPPAKPFDLADYLNENLITKEFKQGDDNFYLYYYHHGNRWEVANNKESEDTTVYFACKVPGDRIHLQHAAKTLTDKEITPKQLKQAYKDLNWI